MIKMEKLKFLENYLKIRFELISCKIEKVIRFFDFYSSNNFWIFANRNLPA